jgi:uncharacterized membrane protein
MVVSKLPKRLLPATACRLQADLVAVVALTLLTVVVVLLPPINETVFRFGFGVLFLLFVPGYALISALFPEAYVPADTTAEEIEAETTGILPGQLYSGTGIDGIDRAALAFGTSVAIVPLIGIVLSFTPWGISLIPIVFTVAGFTLCGIAVAAYRRWQLPEERRFSVPYQTWAASGWSRIFDADSRFDSLLTIVLALSVLLAFGSVAYAVASPPDGEQYSEFYLLTEDSDGELTADGYPTELVAGEPEPIVVGIENYEGTSTEYTVVVEIHEVEFLEDNRVRVVDRERVDTLETTIDAGETWRTEHDLMSTMTGADLRVTYLLYVDEPPAEPATDTADQSLHLWVDVDDPATVSEN